MAKAAPKKKSMRKAAKPAAGAKQQKIALAAGAAGVGFLLWRNMTGSKTTTTAGAAAGAGQQSSASVAPYTPQTPVTLESGESVYDPNTGELLTGNDPSTTPAQTTTPSAPSYSINVTYPKTPTAKKTAKKPAKRTVKKPTVKKPPVKKTTKKKVTT